MSHPFFNIRVYALIINEHNQLLVSDEYVLNTSMTKFPGGGLEFGEGTLDCLKREAIEEFGQPLEIIDHFYTTDYYQPALFFENCQLISIYYRARFIDELTFKTSTLPHDYGEAENGKQSFRWVNIQDLRPEEFSFPIDKKVVEMLLTQQSQKKEAL